VLESFLPFTSFPLRIELDFERNTTYLSGFSSGRNIHFVENRPIDVLKRHVHLLEKKAIVRSSGVCHIFPY
jgi:hypothetical protein